MTFDAPFLLAAAPVIGAAIALLAIAGRRRRVARAMQWSEELGAVARRTGRWGALALGAAGVVAGIGLAGPRGGRATIEASTQALSVVMAMDISRSMLAEDAEPNRLRRAVREARRLVFDLPEDRLGLIAFAGRSYVLSPLTLDGGAVTLFLEALSPDMASQGGTGLAAALAQGADVLDASRETGDRVLLVFTDGETHDSLDAVLRAAAAIRERRIRLVLVAAGGPTPVRIPLRDSAGVISGYQADDRGEPVETRRRDDILHRVADAADGVLVSAELSDQAGAVRELLSAFKRAPGGERTTADLLPMVWVPALIGALLLGLHTVTRRTAALVVIAWLLLPPRASAQRPAAGVREFERGDPAAAARWWQARADSSSSDTTWYNAGTALLAAGKYGDARRALDRAARSLDPELRFRALYNAGVAALRQAQADSARRDSLLSEATAQLRDALLLEPGDRAAKWNLELATRRRPPPPSGGGEKPPPPPRNNEPAPPPGPNQDPPPGGAPLSPSQAEQILNSVDREERDTRARRLGKSAQTVRGVRDW
ncbi:MAG: VWA domain-containing protein [Gemmatimonadota bacterium]|nr:VWA domain-containing protein [Gemmatimonadota bacterium]